jgi:hypothetical protein
MMMMMVRPLRPGAAAGKYSSAHFQNRECYYNFFKHLVKKWWYARIISSKLELLLQQLILLFWHWWNGSNFFRRFEAKRYVLGGFTNKSHVQHMKAELFGRPSPRSESENFGLWKPFGLGISVFVNLRIYTVNKSTFHKKFPKFQFLAASVARPALMIALLLFLLLLFLFLLAFSSFSHLSLKIFLCRATAHFVPSRGTFCAFPWHISLKSIFVPCYGTFCAFPWDISLKSLFVPCYGTFCAFP